MTHMMWTKDKENGCHHNIANMHTRWSRQLHWTTREVPTFWWWKRVQTNSPWHPHWNQGHRPWFETSPLIKQAWSKNRKSLVEIKNHGSKQWSMVEKVKTTVKKKKSLVKKNKSLVEIKNHGSKQWSMVEKVKTTVKKEKSLVRKTTMVKTKNHWLKQPSWTSKKTHPVHRLSGLPAQCNAAWCTAASVWLAPTRWRCPRCSCFSCFSCGCRWCWWELKNDWKTIEKRLKNDWKTVSCGRSRRGSMEHQQQKKWSKPVFE